MKQVIQSYKTGDITISDVPAPACKAGGVLVMNVNSLISIGTEKSMIEIARKNLFEKAKARPDLVKRFIDKAKKEGLINVYKEAMNRLDEPVALGYSSSGTILKVGQGVSEFAIGDRVACVGAGFAGHAEVIWVPENLCVKLPDNVNFEEASFAMLGGIALQGVRLAKLTFGEKVAVIGLGLLGLLTVQLLNACGCDVIGIDIDENKVALAKEFGAQSGLVPGKDDVVVSIENFTKRNGVDAVIITASSKDNAPIIMAENICRKTGKIVLVGVTDITLTRKTFWEKELTFAVSKAAGPGSLEPTYENKGYDYPVGYVRWTEKRNLEHFIQLLSSKKVNIKPLITHRYNIKNALEAYDMIVNGKERCIGVLLEYENEKPKTNVDNLAQKIIFNSNKLTDKKSRTIGFIGGGMFTKNILLPALNSVDGVNLKGIATSGGVSSSYLGKKFNFGYCTSNYKDILGDGEIDTVLITTPHNMHAKMVMESLQAGKHTFVEKPLCINEEQIKEIISLYNSLNREKPKLMVGFNRRFSGLASKAKSFFANRNTPLVMVYRINAGYIPGDHWSQDKEIGGGRIIGEVCHFVDFLQFITGSYPTSVFAEAISGKTGKYFKDDNISLTIKFEDGSLGTIIYAASGSKTFSRERIELFAEESAVVIDDFKTMSMIKGGRHKVVKRYSQDMGYRNELDYFINSKNFESGELFKGYIYTTLATFKALESMEKSGPIKIDLQKISEAEL